LKINRIVNKPISGQMSPIGFAASGVAYTYLAHALNEMGLGERIPILKIGLSYPLDAEIVIEFASQCRQIIVVEERRSFIERQILDILSPLKQSGKLETQVWGKTFPNGMEGIPSTRGLHPSMLIERLGPLLRELPDLPTEWTNGSITRELSLIEETASNQINIPVRTPTFCPGCPHRDSSSVLLELRRDLLDADYMAKHHNRKPTDLIAHGDTGCYTMYMFEPTVELMHNYSGMGLGGGTGGGIDPFVENKQIVFMGDSTFFHSGQTAISQSISSGQDITYIILDNKTTAMTGHQTHPGLDHDLTGNPQFALEIENMVRGMVPSELARDVRIVRMNPADRQAYRDSLEETILAEGVKVVIADKECGITFHRRTKQSEGQVIREMGFLSKKTHMSVATEVCEYCLECTNVTGCPGLTIVDTNYGPKIQTDFSWCVNDGACHRIGACPSFEEVTIRRKQAPRFGDEHVELDDLPEPERFDLKANDSWRCYITGVGGMGIGICNGILVLAGQEMGYEVQFLNKKGLAIRNGGVFSQLVFSHAEEHAPDGPPKTSSVTPYGKADLLLGLDLLEACRAIDPQQPIRIASKERTVAVVNTAKTPTILGLMGREDFSCSEVEKSIRGATKQGHFFGFNVGELCERVLDSKLYVNIMMLGIVYQKGYLPLSEAAMEKAIRTIIRHQIDRNLRAFHIGRKIALRPDLFVVEPTHQVETARKAFRHKINVIRSRHKGKRGKLLAKKFRVMIKQLNRSTRGLRVEDSLMREVIIRAYDCMVWGGFEYARRYCNHLVEVFHKDDPAQGY
ncbi:MAG: 2-oxoacid:acceptor oxidoreductase family protein, partial [Planctomycetes bacterium]|nr:2-oxoacid:acceptor oxidoreductase family protein [Planctomycetota bacterium]